MANTTDTLYNLFTKCVRESPNKPMLGARVFNRDTAKYSDYIWATSAEVSQMVDDFGSGIDRVFETFTQVGGFGPAPVAIYSANCVEWQITEFSTYRGSRYIVPIFDGSSAEVVGHILDRSGVEVLVCSADRVSGILDLVDSISSLKVIISIAVVDSVASYSNALAPPDNEWENLRKRARNLNIELTDFATAMNLGQHNRTVARPPSLGDVCSINFSPSAHMDSVALSLTHSQFVDSTLSLSLSHDVAFPVYFSLHSQAICYSRLLTYYVLAKFGCIGYSSGRLSSYEGDIQTLKPSVVFAPSQLLEQIYGQINTASLSATGMRGYVIRMALMQKHKVFQATGAYTNLFWDRLIFNKYRSILGGRVQLMLTERAQNGPSTTEFLQLVLSCPIVKICPNFQHAGVIYTPALGEMISD